ncbi:hypothetical protein [Streptomyces lydicus]|uniref:hypothetical protein n=1 Tax=Streptomyces lydicus TaxID=47763 RepID=UPI00379FF233
MAHTLMDIVGEDFRLEDEHDGIEWIGGVRWEVRRADGLTKPQMPRRLRPSWRSEMTATACSPTARWSTSGQHT